MRGRMYSPVGLREWMFFLLSGYSSQIFLLRRIVREKLRAILSSKEKNVVKVKGYRRLSQNQPFGDET
jgi:hypothetical protein